MQPNHWHASSIHLGRVAVLALVAPTFLPGCFLFGEEQELPSVEHSPGFFAELDGMVDRARSAPNAEQQARDLELGFNEALVAGARPDETVALGSTWTKVETFLEIGLRSSAVMEGVEGGETNRVEMLGVAAERALRCDFPAIEAYNDEVQSMGRSESILQRTGPIGRESLDLVLSESEYAQVQRWVESGQWVDGHYERLEGRYEQLWVDAYWETVWQEGSCWDEYLGDDCQTYWVEGTCYDVYVDNGYWDTVCDAYDAWGECLYSSDVWVDAGWWDTVCESGYYAEDCVGLYETVCQEGAWVDVLIDGYWTVGPWIPGQDVWVEGYWLDTSGWQWTMLLDEEAQILSAGIDVVLANVAGSLEPACLTQLAEARDGAEQIDAGGAGQMLRDAIMGCLVIL